MNVTWKYLLAASLMFMSGCAASAMAQQSGTGSSWDVTAAWLKDNIAANAGYSYSVTDSVTYNGSGIAHGSVTTTTASQSVRFGVASNAACRLNFTVSDRVTGEAAYAVFDTKSFDIDLSRPAAGGIKARPFDLIAFVSSNGPFASGSEYTDVVAVRPAAAVYWQIVGLVAVAMDGSPVPPTPYSADLPNYPVPLLFADQSMAMRVATALDQAAGLCGGKPAPPPPS